MKHSFVTHSYKGAYIHTCWNTETQKEEITVQTAQLPNRKAKSILAAKQFITRASK